MKKFVLAIMALMMTAAMQPAQAQHFHVLHEFQDGPKDGASPMGALVRDQAGNLYGTTGFGGTNELGVVYKIDASGAESVLFSFDGSNGSIPIWGVILDQAGNLYGTAEGGANDDGVIFKISPSGEETVLFDFPTKLPIGPFQPSGGLLRDKVGNLYGATFLGGNGNCIDGCGTIYRLDTAGKAHMLHQFTGGADGFGPIRICDCRRHRKPLRGGSDWWRLQLLNRALPWPGLRYGVQNREERKVHRLACLSRRQRQ